MGTVNIDIYKQDRKYIDISFTSEEDIYKLLWMFDMLFEEAYQGNAEALCIVNDFYNMMDKENKSLLEYVKIQTGKSPLTVNDYDRELAEVIAERLNITKEECEKQIYKGVLDLKNKNYDLWVEWINNIYKNIRVDYMDKKENDINYNVDEEKLKQLDYIKKYCVPKYLFKGEEYPKDLQDLIDIQKENFKRLNDLKEKLKTDKQNKQLKEEIRKRINYDIELRKDILILKRHYQIPIEKTNWKGSATNVSFEEFQIQNMSDFEREKQDTLRNQYDDIEDKWQVEKIKEIAKEKLTIRQYVIFNLYFVNELNQVQISDILDCTKQSISSELQQIIKKIKKNL